MSSRLLFACLILALLPRSSEASIILTLEPETALNHLQIGTPVTIDVTLSGMADGDLLGYLSAIVEFDGTLLGTPDSIVDGDAVPNSLDFLGLPFLGAADGDFFTFTDPIVFDPDNDEQKFFSFTVTPIAAGSGNISFSSVFGDLDVEAGDSIPFTVNAADNSATPEPSSLLILLGLGAIASGISARRRWRAKEPAIAS